MVMVRTRLRPRRRRRTSKSWTKMVPWRRAWRSFWPKIWPKRAIRGLKRSVIWCGDAWLTCVSNRYRWSIDYFTSGTPVWINHNIGFPKNRWDLPTILGSNRHRCFFPTNFLLIDYCLMGDPHDLPSKSWGSLWRVGVRPGPPPRWTGEFVGDERVQEAGEFNGSTAKGLTHAFTEGIEPA